MARMLARLPSDVDRTEGSFYWDALAPAAYELFNSATWAQEVLKRGFASTTFGAYLDLRCEEHGISRKEAQKATGTVKITGTAGTVIPAGTLVATEADSVTNTPSVEFETADTVVLGSNGSVTVLVSAVEAGVSGNVAASAITLMITPISGVSGIGNEAALAGGANAESDESLLSRLMLKVRSPGTSGNKADYVQWALEVPGVGGVEVTPLWAGPGTVKVTLLDQAKRAASPAIVAAVQNYIAPSNGGDGLAPIGALVTVEAATEVPIDISVTLTIADGATIEEVAEMIEEGVQSYLAQLAFADPLVRYTKIAAILLEIEAIVDYQNLLVNGGSKNIEMSAGQVAVLGTVAANG